MKDKRGGYKVMRQKKKKKVFIIKRESLRNESGSFRFDFSHYHG